MPPDEKKRFDSFFDTFELGHQDSSCIVLDAHGMVLLWYLPDIIHPLRTVRRTLDISLHIEEQHVLDGRYDCYHMD